MQRMYTGAVITATFFHLFLPISLDRKLYGWATGVQLFDFTTRFLGGFLATDYLLFLLISDIVFGVIRLGLTGRWPSVYWKASGLLCGWAISRLRTSTSHNPLELPSDLRADIFRPSVQNPYKFSDLNILRIRRKQDPDESCLPSPSDSSSVLSLAPLPPPS